jgi:hypothetical protein
MCHYYAMLKIRSFAGLNMKNKIVGLLPGLFARKLKALSAIAQYRANLPRKQRTHHWHGLTNYVNLLNHWFVDVECGNFTLESLVYPISHSLNSSELSE